MRHRTYPPIAHGPLPGLDYLDERPFRRWKNAHLEVSIRGWLHRQPPCLELATLALQELTHRGGDLNALMSFAAVDLEPIAWLQPARTRIVHQLRPSPQTGRGRGNVYVILRGGYTQSKGWYGAYVGSTAKAVETRFLEHRTGKRAAHGLPRQGIELLYSLFIGLNPISGGRPARLEWETRLHETLAPVVPAVTGDVAF